MKKLKQLVETQPKTKRKPDIAVIALTDAQNVLVAH